MPWTHASYNPVTPEGLHRFPDTRPIPSVAMSQSDWSRSVRYYDSIASDYDAQMERVPFNGWARAAFRELVISALDPPASVLDSGCGTGIDTEWLAARGYSVIAYDRSSGMMCESSGGSARASSKRVGSSRAKARSRLCWRCWRAHRHWMA